MSNFPKYSQPQRQGAIGMAMLETWVTGIAGWSMRAVPQQSDFGVDAYLDVVSPAGDVTGRGLAIQVKCGASYLRTKNEQGFVYFGDRKHLGFYMNQPLPTILVVCDPTTNTAWWQLFDASKTDGTEKGWTITIPFRNVLGPETVKLWEKIAGPYRDPGEMMSEYWKFNEVLKHAKIFWEFKRTDIEALRFEPVVELFLRLQCSPEIVRNQRNHVHLSIGGYDDDTRELWEIPEVCRWLKMAEPVAKHWFYFCELDTGSFLLALHHCICDAKTESFDPARRKYRLTYSTVKRHKFFQTHFEWLKDFAIEQGIPTATIDGVISRALDMIQKQDIPNDKE